MTTTEWAQKEIELAIKRENPNWDGESFDYGISCLKSALKAYESLGEDEHSGASFDITASILKRLMANLPLSPITEADFENVKENGYGEYKNKQCPRMFSLFQENQNGKISYNDLHRVISFDLLSNPEIPWSNGQVDRLINELHPITLPYCPTEQRYEVYTKSFVLKGFSDISYENGTSTCDYFIYYTEPNGKKHKLNKLIECGEEVEIKGIRKLIILMKLKKLTKQRELERAKETL